jgi:hypothetical protein
MQLDDFFASLGLFFIGLAILLVVGTIVALIYYIIVTIELETRFRRYRNIALEHFDQILYRAGYSDDIDRIFEAWFPGINVSGDYTHPGYRTGIFFGKEHVDDADWPI